MHRGLSAIVQSLLHLNPMVHTVDYVGTVQRLRPNIEESKQQIWRLLKTNKHIL